MRGILTWLFCWVVLVTSVRAEMLTASESAEFGATVSAGIVEKTVEPKQDLTQPTVEVKSKLEQVLLDNPVGKLNWKNFLRYGVTRAVKNGVPVNTVVLILLFPLVVAMVAAARHLIGVRGAGILTPALLSVAFLATGIWAGVVLFAIILLVTVLARNVLKGLKLQYLPRVSLLLWVVSASVFVTLFGASLFNINQLVTVGIFPILILMLLSETFVDIQQGRSGSEARALIAQTFFLAMISSLLLGSDIVQRAVLLYPEIIFFGVAIFDVVMGRYTGLRLSEYLMYRGIVKEDEEE
ncbi:MAG: Membrane protein [Microgenomates group bacterium GW2011_GWC2_46_7]|nr:MAG: Membrane protein [Microgenomates group bacterium GW2011_GWC2_46_7]